MATASKKTKQQKQTKRVLSLDEAMKVLDNAEDQQRVADRRYRMALRLVRAAAGSPRFSYKGRRLEIRERDNKPFMCDINAA